VRERAHGRGRRPSVAHFARLSCLALLARRAVLSNDRVQVKTGGPARSSRDALARWGARCTRVRDFLDRRVA